MAHSTDSILGTAFGLAAGGQRTPARPATVYDACRTGDMERVRNYVAANGCVTESDANSMTMLHHAAFSGNLTIVDLVLSLQGKQRINVDAEDVSGWTPLHYATDRGYQEVVQRLLDEGANVNARDESRRTPLHLAANNGHKEVVKMLLASGAGKNLKTVVGFTAKRYAEDKGFTELVDLL